MIRRDPRLRQPAEHQQLADMPGVGAIALGTLLVSPSRGRLGRFGEVHDRTDTTQLIGDEPPAGRCLQRDLDLPPTEPLTEPAHTSPVRRCDARPHHLARVGVQPLRGDLRSVLIQAHHDRHLQHLLALASRSQDNAQTRADLPPDPDGPAHAIHQVTPAVLGRRRATQRTQIRPQADNRKESQPAAADGPTGRVGRHRPDNHRL